MISGVKETRGRRFNFVICPTAIIPGQIAGAGRFSAVIVYRAQLVQDICTIGKHNMYYFNDCFFLTARWSLFFYNIFDF